MWNYVRKITLNFKALFSVRIFKITQVSAHKHTLNTAVRNITTYARRTMCQQFPCLTVYEYEADSKLIQLKARSPV